MNSSDTAERRISAKAWWVATMFARRNDQLVVRESRPLDGFYDCLSLRGAHLQEWGTAIEMNRHGGRVRVHNGPGWKPIATGRQDDVVEEPDLSGHFVGAAHVCR